MNFSIMPVQGVQGKRRGAQSQTSGKRNESNSFLALLQELSATGRQDGSSARAPRQMTEREQELAQLQRRIEQVNRTLMSFYVNQKQ